ncbi:hypothetical protein HGRIS_004627 [Hohenbuehelia grisea]|uniref:MMS19 nucleotide excision repair protein n=1 Tax=Hohenbuehelia grisea TaxID=104357 RepID=A0ABR3JCG8_9AGAR
MSNDGRDLLAAMGPESKAFRFIQTWMATERDEEITNTLSGLNNGSFSILAVVKALGEYLTSEESTLRNKGITFLTSVLQKCNPQVLNRQSVHALTIFYRGKLEDVETTTAALQGLVPLSAHPTLSSEDAVDIMKSLFRHVRMKALVQSIRFHVFTVIDGIMATHREALKDMGNEFLNGYTTLAEGEKDPRNLLIAFAIARVILVEFDIRNHVEALYNITFCYFPITFRPPPDDPYGITTEDLQDRLRQCLSATPGFGPLAIPVFLEKLTAGSPATKRDTLQTLSVCLPVYGRALARSAGPKLWSSLKIEIFQPTDPVTEEQAVSTLVVLVKTLVSDEDSDFTKSGNIDSLCKEICEECIEKLREPEKSLAKPSMRVLSAFITTNTSASKHAISQAIPCLVKVFLDPGEASNRPPILSLLSRLLKAVGDTEAIEDYETGLLADFKDEILSIVLMGLESNPCRRYSIECLQEIIGMKELLNEDEIAYVVRSLVEKFLENTDSKETTDALLLFLTKVTTDYLQVLKAHALPSMFAALPDQAPAYDAVVEREKMWQILSALRTLCLPAELFETFVIRLTTKLEIACFPVNQPDAHVTSDCRIAYGFSILKTLSMAMTAKAEDGYSDVPKYIEHLIPNIYNWFLYSAFSSDHSDIVTAPRLLEVAGEIITTVTRALESSPQSTFIAALMSAFFQGDIRGIIHGYPKVSVDTSFAPFEPPSPSKHRHMVILFCSAVYSLHRDVRIQWTDLAGLLSKLIIWILEVAETDLQRLSVMHAVASILNKQAGDLSDSMESSLDRFWMNEIADCTMPLDRRTRAIKIWVWVAKALLVRGHRLGTSFSERLLLLFGQSDIHWQAGKAVGEIGESDTVLTKANYAVVKILVTQKYVNFILPKLIEGAKDPAEPVKQTAYLVALCELIKVVPKPTYEQCMPTLLPLLLRGADLPDSEIRANVIDSLYATAPSEAASVSEHASTLVSIMLKNLLSEDINTPRVRIAALRFLALLPSIVRYDVLHPCKANVIRGLGIALDDPKRNVRKEAVDARTRWSACMPMPS